MSTTVSTVSPLCQLRDRQLTGGLVTAPTRRRHRHPSLLCNIPRPASHIIGHPEHASALSLSLDSNGDGGPHRPPRTGDVSTWEQVSRLRQLRLTDVLVPAPTSTPTHLCHTLLPTGLDTAVTLSGGQQLRPCAAQRYVDRISAPLLLSALRSQQRARQRGDDTTRRARYTETRAASTTTRRRWDTDDFQGGLDDNGSSREGVEDASNGAHLRESAGEY
jgi:hypothetical protein